MTLEIEAIAFDFYGTLVDVGALRTRAKGLVPDPESFITIWRTKQLEYTFLLSLMERYRDFSEVTRKALDFALERFSLALDPAQRERLIGAWLEPTPYPEVREAVAALACNHPLMVLSNGTPAMLEAGLRHAGLRGHFKWVLSADAVRTFKPSPRVYELAPGTTGFERHRILFVSSNSFDVVGAKTFGFTVCRVDRAKTPLDPLDGKPDLTVGEVNEIARTLQAA